MSKNKLLWVNKYEHPQITINELKNIITIFQKVKQLCINKKLHFVYHTTALICEILNRRVEYILYLVDPGKHSSEKLSYPTSFLGSWLKHLTLKKKIASGICNSRCAQLFSKNSDVSANTSVVECLDDSTKTYPMGAPFLDCGPTQVPPRVCCTNKWTDVYEVKYAYYTGRILQNSLVENTTLVKLLSALSNLFRVRYKTNIGYTPGVGNNLLDVARERFYSTYGLCEFPTTTG